MGVNRNGGGGRVYGPGGQHDIRAKPSGARGGLCSGAVDALP